MKSLNEDLKTGQFKQIYLLYGEEAYLKKLYKNRSISWKREAIFLYIIGAARK